MLKLRKTKRYRFEVLESNDIQKLLDLENIPNPHSTEEEPQNWKEDIKFEILE